MPSCIFYHHLCQWCSCTEFLKKCANCRLVSYCTIEHQKYDWKIHKHLCKIVTELNKKKQISLFKFHGDTQEEWNEHRTNIMLIIELQLKRKLEVFERQMILFPNVCNVCYQYNAVAVPCNHCRCIFYCCDEHLIADKVEHEKNCKAFKLCFEADLLLIRNDRSTNINTDYYSLLKNTFPNSIDEFLEDGSKGILEKCLASEEISCIFSLLYGIFKCNRKEVCTSTVLSVHILGCNELESSLINFMEFFFHWFPQLNKVDVLMIGPDCDITSYNELITKEYKNGKCSTIKRIKNLYHEYVRENDFEQPNIVVAFNCGFAEFINTAQDTWNETINCLMNFDNIIIVITSYTQIEAKNDISRIITCPAKKEPLNIIINAAKNPFRSLRPLRDWESNSVFYLNNFISVLDISA